jgi:hypothetical protein
MRSNTHTDNLLARTVCAHDGGFRGLGHASQRDGGMQTKQRGLPPFLAGQCATQTMRCLAREPEGERRLKFVGRSLPAGLATTAEADKRRCRNSSSRARSR